MIQDIEKYDRDLESSTRTEEVQLNSSSRYLLTTHSRMRTFMRARTTASKQMYRFGGGSPREGPNLVIVHQ